MVASPEPSCNERFMRGTRPSAWRWWKTCVLCLVEPAGPIDAMLCHACRRRLDRLGRRVGSSAQITALFRYRTSMRDLILRAKVQSDHRALDLLTRLAVGHPAAIAVATWADVLIVCPSSLWGRARGRLDVAHHIAAGLGAKVGRPVLPGPPHLYWRVRKRAQHKQEIQSQGTRLDGGPPWPWRRSLDGWVRRLNVDEEAGRRFLLVDDVVTTGQTLHSVAAHLPEGARFRALTLAKGGNLRPSTVGSGLVDMGSRKSTKNHRDIP